jgi:hypothetical protein
MLCVTEGAVEVVKLGSPVEKVAETTSNGAVSELVAQVAWWVVGSRGAPGQMVTTPFAVVAVKVTVSAGPVVIGVNPAVDDNVATKLTEVSTANDDVGGVIARVVGAECTVSGIVLELAEMKLVSVAMLATTVYEPAGRAPVVHAAVPAAGAIGFVHPGMRVFTPPTVVKKLTNPVGVIPLLGVMVAVKVTGPFNVEAGPELERLTAGVACVTVWVIVAGPEAVKFVSPV